MKRTQMLGQSAGASEQPVGPRKAQPAWSPAGRDEARGRGAGEAQRGNLVVGEDQVGARAAAVPAVPAAVRQRVPMGAAAARLHGGEGRRERLAEAAELGGERGFLRARPSGAGGSGQAAPHRGHLVGARARVA